MSDFSDSAARRNWTRRAVLRLGLLLMLAVLLSPGALAAKHKAAGPPKSQLADGQKITITGTLKIERRGWNQYLMLVTSQKYKLMFNPADAKPETVHEVGLQLPWKGPVLAEFIGRQVTATGTIQLNASSPYYWNGGLLVANSVVMPGGGIQTPGSAPAPPDTLRLYKSTVTLRPGVYAWDRSAENIETNKPIDARLLYGLDGCGLNGGGDVLNCTCAADFVAVRGGMQDATGLKLHAVQGGVAQFEVDETAEKPVTVQVECARRKEKK